MELEEIVKILQDTGVTIAILAYFMVRDWKFMGQLQETLQTLVDVVDRLKESIKGN